MEILGGFALARQLGAGSRAEVFLGRSGDSPIARSTAAVAVKVYRAATPVADIETEIEALSRTDSDHLLRLIDVTTAPDHKPALILVPVGVRRLSDLVVGNRSLSLGEVVTVTAPLVGALAELHRVGVSHGAIRLSNIVFDRRGAPVLVGFGRATLIGDRPVDTTSSSLPPAIMSENSGVAADLADLAVVIRCVCATSRANTSGVTDWLDRMAGSADPTRWLQQLEGIIYDLAAGEPIRFDGQSMSQLSVDTDPRDLRSEVITVVHHDDEPGERRAALTESRDARRTSLGETIGLPAPILELIRTPIPATVLRLAIAARAVRRPFWLAGGVVAAVLVAALVFVPDDGRAPASAVEPQNTVSPSQSAGVDQTPAHQNTKIQGDDPAAALEALIDARAECLDLRSLTCLEQVDQSGSAAWDADSTFLARYEAGTPTDPLLYAAAETTVTLTDRLGDSAIASAVDAASRIPVTVLLIRGDDGWRIRDIIAP